MLSSEAASFIHQSLSSGKKHRHQKTKKKTSTTKKYEIIPVKDYSSSATKGKSTVSSLTTKSFFLSDITSSKSTSTCTISTSSNLDCDFQDHSLEEIMHVLRDLRDRYEDESNKTDDDFGEAIQDLEKQYVDLSTMRSQSYHNADDESPDVFITNMSRISEEELNYIASCCEDERTTKASNTKCKNKYIKKQTTKDRKSPSKRTRSYNKRVKREKNSNHEEQINDVLKKKQKKQKSGFNASTMLQYISGHGVPIFASRFYRP